MYCIFNCCVQIQHLVVFHDLFSQHGILWCSRMLFSRTLNEWVSQVWSHRYYSLFHRSCASILLRKVPCMLVSISVGKRRNCWMLKKYVRLRPCRTLQSSRSSSRSFRCSHFGIALSWTTTVGNREKPMKVKSEWRACLFCGAVTLLQSVRKRTSGESPI